MCAKECPDSWDFHNKAPSQLSHPLFFVFVFPSQNLHHELCASPPPPWGLVTAGTGTHCQEYSVVCA